MANQAELIYDIDSSAARSAATDLAKMNAAAASAAGGADKLNKALRDNQGRFKSSASVAKEYGNEVKSLADKYNPALSAVYKFQSAQVELNRAVALGVLTQSQADAALDRVSAGLQRATASAQSYATGMRGVNNIQGSVGNQFAQLNDIVVTAWGGMNPALIGMQQGMHVVQGFAGQSLPQALGALRGAFAQLLNPVTLGTVAVIAGAAALIQWGSSALGAGGNTISFKDSISETQAAITELNNVTKLYSIDGLGELQKKYGAINQEVLELLENQRLLANLEATEKLRASLNAISNELGSGLFNTAYGEIREVFKVTANDAQVLYGVLENISSLRTFDMQVDSLRRIRGLLSDATNGFTEMNAAQVKMLRQLTDAEEAARQLAQAAPKGNWMDAAIGGVSALGSAIRARISEVQQLNSLSLTPRGNLQYSGRGEDPRKFGANAGQSNTFTTENFAVPEFGGVGGGGGAGGTGDQKLQSLIQSLQNQRAVTEAWYLESQALLSVANEQELAIIGGKYAALEALEAQYRQKKFEQDQASAQMTYQAYAGALGAASDLLGMFAGESRAAAIATIAIQKGLAIAQIVMNTSVAQMRALAELGPIAGAAAAARIGLMGKIQAGIVAATGLAQASGAGRGGVGGVVASTGAASTSAFSSPQRNILVRLQGPDFLTDMAESIMTQIYEQSRDGRVVIQRDR